MKCPKCQSEIRDDALFCSECGAKIIIQPSSDNTQTTQNPNQPNPNQYVGSRVENRAKQKQSNKTTIIIVAVLVVAVVLAACYFLFFRSSDDSSDSDSDSKTTTTKKEKTDTKKIKLEEDEITVAVGDTAYIEANVDCTYKVKDETICSVDRFGTVKGLKEGSTTVTCKSDNGKASCKITVEAATTTTTISGDYVFPNSSSTLLTESDLTGKSEWELRIGINEIYARHHCTFKTQEIVDYFNSKSWYSADPNLTSDIMNANVSAYLNDTEVTNVNFIRTYQQSH